MLVISKVHDRTQVGEVRRTATEAARRSGFLDGEVGRVALVATEIATNIVRHGGGGIVVVRQLDTAGGHGLELLGLDRGPGMANVARCLVDGFSTAGSPGTGLGAITRNADRYAIYSRPGHGTAIMASFHFGRPVEPPGWEIGVVIDCHPGESLCGDNWAATVDRSSATLLVVDGSGHGPLAARAAETAIRIFGDNFDKDCVSLVAAIHRGLAPTRGAALAVARIDATARLLRFVGIGNISGVVANDGRFRRLASYNGTAGHVVSQIREFTYPFVENPLVILHSDGVSPKWDIDTYPGLMRNHPSLVAGVAFRDHRRDRDDAAVVAIRKTG
jgi:anti-sigma regulatory factor (Ser/Thr protein kinase)